MHAEIGERAEVSSSCRRVAWSSCHGDTSDRFARGDFAAVAMTGGGHEWQTYAALGLIGKTREAVEGLTRFDNEEAAFYLAVARWIGGEDEEAARLLKPILTDQARNLLAFLRKPRIDVLTQWSWARSGCADLLAGAAGDTRFRVANISFHPDDLPNKPYGSIHDYCASSGPPDFYICTMIEWHLVPPNLQELSCPLFGQTGDYDLHIQTVHPWLRLFDAILVTDPSEWRDVSRLVRVPVYSFPKSFGVPQLVPPLRQGQREIDVYLSGTMLHPYHLDKSQLIHQLLDIPGLRINVINGFTAPAEYYNDLARSKICITFVRHPTALPTRGLEALAMGCALIVQEDNVLTLFTGREHGVLTYQLERRDLPSVVRSILENWPEFTQRAEAGARIVREEFSLERVASQYLRFLTFLASQPRGQRSLYNTEQLYQKRGVLHKGWLPSGDLRHCPVLRGMAIHNYWRLRSALTPEPASPHVYIDIARESVLGNCHRAEAGLVPVPKWLAYLCDLYRTARERFPRSLVVRFNGIRVMLHFGTPEIVSEALPLLDEVLSLPPDYWQIDVMEDVFPWDFFPQFFNYRGYFDRITQHLTQGHPVEPDLCRLILASLHAYRGFYPAFHGFYSQALDDYGAAAALDPDFPYFQLWYAEQLLQRGLREDKQPAYRLLRELASGSVVFREALEMLVQSGEADEDIARRASRIREILQIRESMAAPKLQLRPELQDIECERDKAWREWQNWKDEREHLCNLIHGMESSKFWKLRQKWFKLKRRFLRK
ncbi:MAG TPA: glycosyltransferase [Gemmataceae bacterium]|nr:glycosyltransferase [Gemmataceae bacterium]